MDARAALIAAVETDDLATVMRLLSDDPAVADARNDQGVSVVLLSRYRNARAVTDALLSVDPELDVFDAAALGYVDRLHDHLDDDPEQARAFSTDGFTPLHLAAFFGKGDAARILIAGGADVNAVAANAMRVQPLHSAAAGRHHEVCRLLLAAGADVDAAQEGGYTPLHQAAHSGDVELVELFLSAGADTHARMDDGQTPAELAASSGHPDLAARLREVADR